MPTKHNYFIYYFFEGTFASFYNDKKIKKKSQNSRIDTRFFLIFLLYDGRIRIRICSKLLADPDPGGPKT
jgi:hypothetical protein